MCKYDAISINRPRPGKTGNNKLQAPPELKIGANKFQMTISQFQIRSNANCLEF
jgi:hypothetical protein